MKILFNIAAFLTSVSVIVGFCVAVRVWLRKRARRLTTFQKVVDENREKAEYENKEHPGKWKIPFATEWHQVYKLWPPKELWKTIWRKD